MTEHSPTEKFDFSSFVGIKLPSKEGVELHWHPTNSDDWSSFDFSSLLGRNLAVHPLKGFLKQIDITPLNEVAADLLDLRMLYSASCHEGRFVREVGQWAIRFNDGSISRSTLITSNYSNIVDLNESDALNLIGERKDEVSEIHVFHTHSPNSIGPNLPSKQDMFFITQLTANMFNYHGVKLQREAPPVFGYIVTLGNSGDLEVYLHRPMLDWLSNF